jgi:hypothetical protein
MIYVSDDTHDVSNRPVSQLDDVPQEDDMDLLLGYAYSNGSQCYSMLLHPRRLRMITAGMTNMVLSTTQSEIGQMHC